VKYAWIDTQCRQYPLSVLCEVLAVSINGYRAWKRGGTTVDSLAKELRLALQYPEGAAV
jgi:hypothetical protein